MLGKSTLQSAFAHWKGITRASKEGLEVWAPVSESHYLVSTFGNVKNGKTGRLMAGAYDNGYKRVCLCFSPGKRSTPYIHRLVAAAFLLNPSGRAQVDHIDNNKQNNHVFNLRYATISENQMNKPLQKNNKSGITGVVFVELYQKWKAQIQVNSKCKHLGCFETREEAVAARLKASNEIFGEFTHSSQKIA